MGSEARQLAAPAVAADDGFEVEMPPGRIEELFQHDKEAVAGADVAELTDAELVAEDRRHALCEAWAGWCRTRRYFGPPPLPASLLGKMQKRTGLRPREPDGVCSAELLALHMAIQAQPVDAVNAKVFRLTYEHRVRNVKAAAGALGISRQHWYRLLREFRQTVCTASANILLTFEADAQRVVGGSGTVLEDEQP